MSSTEQPGLDEIEERFVAILDSRLSRERRTGSGVGGAQRANSVARLSRMTVIRIWPG